MSWLTDLKDQGKQENKKKRKHDGMRLENTCSRTGNDKSNSRKHIKCDELNSHAPHNLKPLSFVDKMQENKIKIENEYKRICQYKNEILEKEEKIKHLRGRTTIRIMKDLQKEIKQKKEYVEKLEKKELTKEFEAQIQPYRFAHEQQELVEKMKMNLGWDKSKVGSDLDESGNKSSQLSGSKRTRELTGGASPVNCSGVNPDSSKCSPITTGNAHESNGLLAFVNTCMKKKEEKKCPVLESYLVNTEGKTPVIQFHEEDRCNQCNETLILDPLRSILGCPICGSMKPYLDATSSSMAYGDEVEFTSFAYKRSNHFNECLHHSQAKESTQIPDNILDKVMSELYIERITNLKDITMDKTKAILKKLKLRKYYEHNTQLWCRLTGNPPPRMSPEQEEKCRLMFTAIQEPFEKHRPPDRVNFLSYSYCLHKFCQLLGYSEFLKYFGLLKGEEKLKRQDVIFRKICETLDWEFIPSL